MSGLSRLFLVGSLIVVSGCSTESDLSDASGHPLKPKNLLLITLDTTRADRIGCYGYEGASTPHIDALARSGVKFETCLSPTPLTLPSHASILTGLYPFRHGVRNNGTHRLPSDVMTLGERFEAEGFQTGAVISAFVLDSRFGLDRGFGSYDDDLSEGRAPSTFGYRETKASATVARTREWLGGRGTDPWFLWVHFFDPHAPYEAPSAFSDGGSRSDYDAEISYVDDGIGQIVEGLKKRGILEETLIVVSADHGESLGEHGEPTHTIFVYDATTKVPLIFTHRSLLQGKSIDATVSSVDILPTLLELFGLPPEPDLDGRSLAAALRDDEAHLGDQKVYLESMAPYLNHGWSGLRAIRDRTARYVDAPKPEFYDLAEDPKETRNQYETSRDRLTSYESAMDAMRKRGDRDARHDTGASMDEATREKLAALGYVWTQPEQGSLSADRSRPDPKDRIHDLVSAEAAIKLVHGGQYAEAVPRLEALVAKDPNWIVLREALATCYEELDRREDSWKIL